MEQQKTNEAKKIKAIDSLLEICESLELPTSDAISKLEAATKQVRTTMTHRPGLDVETIKSNRK